MAVGGHVEHVHILFALPASMTLSEAVQKIKANSSRWMKENGCRLFSWQEGYSAFSVSVSGADATIRYIRSQAEHHARRTFDEEIAAILRNMEWQAIKWRPLCGLTKLQRRMIR